MNDLINVLEKGELAVLPSDTVYGIFADATNVESIRRVDEAKGSNKPHLIVVSDIKTDYAEAWKVWILNKDRVLTFVGALLRLH